MMRRIHLLTLHFRCLMYFIIFYCCSFACLIVLFLCCIFLHIFKTLSHSYPCFFCIIFWKYIVVCLFLFVVRILQKSLRLFNLALYLPHDNKRVCWCFYAFHSTHTERGALCDRPCRLRRDDVGWLIIGLSRPWIIAIQAYVEPHP